MVLSGLFSPAFNARKHWRLAILARHRGLSTRKTKKYLRTGRLEAYAERSPIFRADTLSQFSYNANGDDDILTFTFERSVPVNGF